MFKFFKFLSDMLTNKCNCGKKATKYPHGIPCCDGCFHEVDCMTWLGGDCDCSNSMWKSRQKKGNNHD